MPAVDNPGAGQAARWVRGPLPWALIVGVWWWGVELTWTWLSGANVPPALSTWLALGLILVPVTILGLVAELGAALARWNPLGRGQAGYGAWLHGLVNGAHERNGTWRAAQLLALVQAGAVYFGLAFLATERLVVEMAQPRFSALTIGGAHLVALTFAALAFPALCAPSAFLVRHAARVPVVGGSLSSVRGLLLWGAALGLITMAIVLRAQRELASFLPWRSVLPALAGLVLGSIDRSVLPRLPARAQRGIVVGLLLVCGGTLVGTLLLGTDQASARRAALAFSHGARLGAGATERLADFDRDGYVHVAAGGDCAPFDRRRHPGAVDVPDNGKDEDCDGSDLVLSRIVEAPTRAYALPASIPAKPPIVLLTIDAFAARRMAALGGKRNVTPHIDALAERSALFTSCFSQGPSTRLSFPSIFTSRHDSQIRRTLVGKHPYPLEPSEKLLAQFLSRAGYDTAAVVSDTYFSKSRWSTITRGFTRVIESPFRNPKHPVHNSSLVTDAAIAELNRPRKQPLFLWLHYYDAHSPHHQPTGTERYGNSRADVYDAELSLVDREVGRFVDALRKRLPEALLVLSADHGIAFDEPRHEQLNYGYDLHSVTLHVPLLFNAPFVPVRHHDGVVGTMDIAPTLTAIARVTGRQSFEGMSLWPELLEGKRDRPARLVHEFFITERRWKAEDPLEIISLRTDHYNLIHDRRDGSYQLYDWRKDYLENDDLSENPEQRGELKALKQQLAAFTYRLYDPRDNPPASGEAVRK